MKVGFFSLLFKDINFRKASEKGDNALFPLAYFVF